MITNLNHYITIEEAAADAKVTTKTVLNRISLRKTSSIKIDGKHFVLVDFLHTKFRNENPNLSIGLNNMETVLKFSKRNHVSPLLLYENIIAGRIDAVSVSTKVLITPSDPAVLAFVSERRKKYKKKPR